MNIDITANRYKIVEIIDSIITPERPGNTLLQWLDNESDFWLAPCSAEHHLNVEGGLALHSLHVYECLKKKCEQFPIVRVKSTIAICGLFHDLAKANYYVKEKRNKKIDGQWREIEAWGYDNKFPIPHGSKSVIILQSLIMLTDIEKVAICHHMGPFEAMGIYSLQKTYNEAQGYHSLVPALHIADMEATHLMEREM